VSRLRVLVVEDSLTIRRRLVEVLGSAEDFEVVAEASNGSQAIDLCAQHRPDVVTMDMMLPGITGLGATEHIMAHFPTPILVVSSSFNRGELFRTYDALAAGAVDMIEKPTGQEPPGVWEKAFLSALRIVARVRVITHLRARLEARRPPRESMPAANGRAPALLAIGASTGGPGALVELLGGLQREFSPPVLVVLHLGLPFAGAFAEWLGQQIRRDVRYAVGGERLGALSGRVVLAPPDRHLVVNDLTLALSDAPERHSCRPSVDVLFESLLRAAPRVAACLLTGMGKDGALGLLALRQGGAFTVAQDEATSIVYGMPREAVLIGAASRTLPLPRIASAVESWLGGHGEGPG
jgi:two-component system, chemotaxis family, protein-glutamate methylesterase/glutaminase